MSEKKRSSENAIDDSTAAKISKSTRSPSPSPNNLNQTIRTDDLSAIPIPLLNDDCSIHIFSYVSNEDLCSVGDSCRRFSALAAEAFRVKNRREQFKIDTRHTNHIQHKRNVKILGSYGHVMENVALDWGWLPTENTSANKLWRILYTKCTQLKVLHLHGRMPRNILYTLDDDFPSPRRFRLVTTLSIQGLSYCGESFMRLMAKHFKNVEDLNILAQGFADNYDFPISLPKLRNLTLAEISDESMFACRTNASLLTSLTSANQLESLKVDMESTIDNTCNWMALGICINLKSLTIKQSNTHFGVHFIETLSKKLKRLERLHLEDSCNHSLSRTEVDKVIECIVGRFASLETLTMTHYSFYHFDEAVFVEWVNLRKGTNSAVPLDISLKSIEFPYDDLDDDPVRKQICSEVQERHKHYIRLHYDMGLDNENE